MAPIAASLASLDAAVVVLDATLERTHFAETQLSKLALLRDHAIHHFAELMTLCDKRAHLVQLDQNDSISKSQKLTRERDTLEERFAENTNLLNSKMAAQKSSELLYAEEKKKLFSAAEEMNSAKQALGAAEREQVQMTEEMKQRKSAKKKQEEKITKLENELNEK